MPSSCGDPRSIGCQILVQGCIDRRLKVQVHANNIETITLLCGHFVLVGIGGGSSTKIVEILQFLIVLLDEKVEVGLLFNDVLDFGTLNSQFAPSEPMEALTVDKFVYVISGF